MSEVKENGTDPKNEAPESTELGAEEQKTAGSTIKGPGFGINEEGYFFVEAHMSLPHALIQGTLLEAAEFLQENHPNSMRARSRKAKEKQIIQPQRGFRGFNLFGKR